MSYTMLGIKRKRRQQKSQITRVRNKLSLLFLRVTLAVLLITIITVAGAVIGTWRGIIANSPEIPIHEIRPINYASIIVCARTGAELTRLHAGVNRTNVTLDQIPEHVRNAFIAIEDERFYYHNGIDIRSIGRALWVLFSNEGTSAQGASTITQQLIKNRLERFDSDLITKLQEQYLAVQFERDLADAFGDCTRRAKDYILEVYLNTINLGRTNHGVQAAALFYYGVDVWDLSLAQAATIAAITQNPTRFPPDTRPENNWERARLVLYKMHELGFITEEEFYEAYCISVYDTIVRGTGGEARATVSPFDCFTDALLAQLRSDLIETLNITEFEADRIIFTQGLRIYTTQNTEMQAIVDDVILDDSMFPGAGFQIDVLYLVTVQNNITGHKRDYSQQTTVRNMEEAEAFITRMQYELLGSNDTIISERRIFTPQPQSAFVLMDHHNGHVLAVRGLRGDKTESRGFCRATMATRSPGSQLKPLVFAAGFDLGLLTPASTIDDVPWAITPNGGQRYQPGNWWGRRYYGLSTSRRAIHTSMNIVSVRALVEDIGIETGFAYMLNFGLTTLEGETWAGRPFSDRIPALALGGLTEGVILLELAAAYATIANQGYYNRPIFYTHVIDHSGNLLIENTHIPHQVIHRETAYLLTDTMRDTLRAPGATGHQSNFADPQMRRDIPIAGKTGTSQHTRDLGFTGYTPYFTAAIWMGYDDNQHLPPGSSNYHMRIWRAIMERIHEDLPPRQFPDRPAGIAVHTVCRDSGHPATEVCRIDPRGNRVHSEIFASGTVPLTPCPIHQQFEICTIHGYLAGPYCHSYYIETRVGIVRPIPVPDFAIGANIGDRHLDFSASVLEGHVCLSCYGYHIDYDYLTDYGYRTEESDYDESTWGDWSADDDLRNNNDVPNNDDWPNNEDGTNNDEIYIAWPWNWPTQTPTPNYDTDELHSPLSTPPPEPLTYNNSSNT